MRINTLFVIMKMVERCNLNCSYCYYYAPGNAEVYSRPPKMSGAILDRLIEYMEQAADENDIGEVVFAFHGGEPTLAKPDAVSRFCDDARTRLGGHAVKVKFAIQTNGVHLTDAWLKVIAQHRIHVGVSLDGDEESHDRHRIDHRGHGSYARIRQNIKKLKPIVADAEINLVALTVMASGFKGLDYYRHMVDELGLRDMKLLFPDHTNDAPPTEEEARELGQALCEIFDHWLLHDSRRVRVVLFQDAVRNVMMTTARQAEPSDGITLGCAVLSDGLVRISDDYMAPAAWFAEQKAMSLHDSTFAQWLAQPHVEELLQASFEVPTACRSCAHAKSCRGGEIPHRHSAERGFDNPSAHCTSLKIFYDHVTRILNQGMDEVESMRRARVEMT
ncbi:radical SAM protein [[Pseudomonas] boreopolis]|uniref:radical SAM protein n=1 Tax=Xanthomonas boreopolis TaxID=86183 RepID=UPI003DA0504D